MKVIIVSIDALRADSLGCYGYERDTSPEIDTMAAAGVLFKNCYTPANWTNPSYYSLITGLYPSVHGVSHHRHGLAGKVRTLPESLAAAGYKTFLYSNFYTLLDEKRFGSHFQNRVYFDIDRDSDRLKEIVAAPEDRDLFFLIHIGSYVHEPYCAPEEMVREFWPGEIPREKEEIRRLTEEMNLSDESMRNVLRKVNLHRSLLSRTEVEYLKACYDAGIKYIDRWVGDFFNVVEKSSEGEYLFILTADHGQGFFEHGFFGHGLSLYQELVRIPLILRGVGRRGGEVSNSISLMDIYPTLLDIFGFDIPQDIDGVSFRSSLEWKESEGRRVICEGLPFMACIHSRQKLITSFYHLMPWREKLKRIGNLIRHRKWRRLLLHLYSFCKTGFYDLEKDPGEMTNRAWRGGPEMRELKIYLKNWYGRCRHRSLEITEEEIDDEKIIEQLKGLGYL